MLEKEILLHLFENFYHCWFLTQTLETCFVQEFKAPNASLGLFYTSWLIRNVNRKRKESKEKRTLEDLATFPLLSPWSSTVDLLKGLHLDKKNSGFAKTIWTFTFLSMSSSLPCNASWMSSFEQRWAAKYLRVDIDTNLLWFRGDLGQKSSWWLFNLYFWYLFVNRQI